MTRPAYRTPQLRTVPDRSRTRVAGVFVMMTLTMAVLSSTAEAVVVQTSHRTLNGGTADFGDGSHFLGGPSGSGVITYDYSYDSTGRLRATGRVRGTLYWDSFGNPGCARLRITFDDGINDGSPIEERQLEFCGPGGDANDVANQLTIDESLGHVNLARIIVRVSEVRAGRAVNEIGTPVFAPKERRYFTAINSGTADFGRGIHVGGAPADPGEITFNRGLVLNGDVFGTLYWDALFEDGCARIIIEFQDKDAAVLNTRTITRCGPGGNANDPDNRRLVDEVFQATSCPCPGHNLFRVRLRVGSLSGSSFVNVTSRTFSYNGAVGDFELPPNGTVTVHERLNYAFTWTVPEPLNWHDLRSLQLRIRDDAGTALWVRWDESSNTFSLFNEAAGKFGRGVAPGKRVRLQTPDATLHLSHTSVRALSSVLGTGPTSPTVALNLGLSFKRSAAGRTFYVEVAASDDLWNEDPFVQAGTLTVRRQHDIEDRTR